MSAPSSFSERVPAKTWTSGLGDFEDHFFLLRIGAGGENNPPFFRNELHDELAHLEGGPTFKPPPRRRMDQDGAFPDGTHQREVGVGDMKKELARRRGWKNSNPPHRI